MTKKDLKNDEVFKKSVEGIQKAARMYVNVLEQNKERLEMVMESYATLPLQTKVVLAFHEVQICADQNITALLRLDMVLNDVLEELQ